MLGSLVATQDAQFEPRHFSFQQVRIIVMRNLTLSILFFCALQFCASYAKADTWSDQIIATRKIDFGVIATGSEAKQFIEVKNVLRETLHIAGVSASCACVQYQLPDNVSSKYLQPGESCFIEVKMDTQKFRQKRDASLLIRIDSPRYVEHSIPVSAYIRTDVVFNPGMVRFGEVEMGKPSQSVVEIAYAGRADWDIVDIKFDNTDLKASLSPPQRSAGLVNFKLTMSLSETAKAGRLRDIVTLVTNDKTNPYIPLMVDGLVVPDITVSPAVVKVGNIGAGQTTMVQVALKGKTPFKVEDIDCKGMEDCFKVASSDAVRSFHLFKIEFNAPNRAGEFNEEMLVKIAGRPEPLRFNVTGVIIN